MLVLLTVLAAAAQAPTAQPASDADTIVCKRAKTSDVGSHLRPQKVCMKKSDWELMEKNTQNELQTLHDRSSFDPGRNPAGGGPH